MGTQGSVTPVKPLRRDAFMILVIPSHAFQFAKRLTDQGL